MYAIRINLYIEFPRSQVSIVVHSLHIETGQEGVAITQLRLGVGLTNRKAPDERPREEDSIVQYFPGKSALFQRVRKKRALRSSGTLHKETKGRMSMGVMNRNGILVHAVAHEKATTLNIDCTHKQ